MNILALTLVLVIGYVSAFSLGRGHVPTSQKTLQMVKIGDKAPDFDLSTPQGKNVKLSSFKGKSNVVLFFYPSDNSPGCTKEVCAFEKRAPDFKGKAQVFGISSGGESDKLKFIKSTKLTTASLLMDTENKAREAFNVPKAVFGLLPGRVTYVIGKDGTVKGIYDDFAKAEMHPEEALKITIDLLRKRAEHNEGMISTLEEISLHQEELESINEVIATNCRKIKILYLQNNIIRKMENLKFMRSLEYLNLALNNISKIEGLQNCEFLNKLDLTLNFIDFDTLEVSIRHLQRRENLRDLYMMGNPSQSEWEDGKFNHYVIAMLPQLRTIDGTEITKSMQILARQKLPALKQELVERAATSTQAKRAKMTQKELDEEAAAEAKAAEKPVLYSDDVIEVADVDDEDDADAEIARNIRDADEATENTPEAREEIYREMAQQKKEKQDREDAMKPKKRDYEAEHKATLEATRRREEESGEREVRQKNEGGWRFRWDEESKRGQIVLEVSLSRHLDSSLIDVDVHPHYVSMIIKGKVLRLSTPYEVIGSKSRCERSKTTGSLMVIMPMQNPGDNFLNRRSDEDRARIKDRHAVAGSGGNAASDAAASAVGAGYIGGDRADRHLPKKGSASGGGRTLRKAAAPSLYDQMAAAAAGAREGTDASLSSLSKPAASVFDIDAEIEKLEVGETTSDGKLDLGGIAKGPNSRQAQEREEAAQKVSAKTTKPQPDEAPVVELEVPVGDTETEHRQHAGIQVVEAGADGTFEI